MVATFPPLVEQQAKCWSVWMSTRRACRQYGLSGDRSWVPGEWQGMVRALIIDLIKLFLLRRLFVLLVPITPIRYLSNCSHQLQVDSGPNHIICSSAQEYTQPVIGWPTHTQVKIQQEVIPISGCTFKAAHLKRNQKIKNHKFGLRMLVFTPASRKNVYIYIYILSSKDRLFCCFTAHQ